MKPKKKSWKKFFLRWFIYLVIIWFCSSLIATYSLTLRRGKQHPEPIPENTEAKIDSFQLTTSDNQTLGAWHVHGQADKPVILLFHGIGGCRSFEFPSCKFLIEKGYPIVMVTQRTHGDSTGNRHDFGISNKNDVLAAVDWTEKNLPNRKVIIFGRSLGSAAALFASEQLGERVSGYILESPFKDLYTATRNRTKHHLPPVIEYVAFAGLQLSSFLILSNASDISPANAAMKMPKHAQVLILCGDKDRLATVAESQFIHEQLGERSQIVVVPNADHYKLQETNKKLFEETIHNFLKRFE